MKKILVIEDNDNNLYLIRFMLEKNGYQVIEAKEGLMGVTMALKEKPDLVLIDIQLPDINGMEATKRIRAAETVDKVPIVAVTSYALAGDREKALAAGCTGYIEKPINPETFVGEVNHFL
jgi:two-component system cell cycle response regulator DivK